MQGANTIAEWGIVLLIIGLLIMAFALMKEFGSETADQKVETSSKGIILIGPIPIVWGFGKRTGLIILVVFCILLLWTLITLFG